MKRLSWSQELAIRLIAREAATEGCVALSTSDPGITDDIWQMWLVREPLDVFYQATAAIDRAIGENGFPANVEAMDKAVTAGRAVVQRDRPNLGMGDFVGS